MSGKNPLFPHLHVQSGKPTVHRRPKVVRLIIMLPQLSDTLIQVHSSAGISLIPGNGRPMSGFSAGPKHQVSPL
jgi:hypothetical protein